MTVTKNVLADKDRALGLALQLPGQSDLEIAQSLEELAELLKTAGIEMVGSVTQKRDKASRAFYMGTGKIEEIAQIAADLGATLIVADDELSAIQIKMIEDGTKIPVRDRTSVILDIFASHASTHEGKLQVELASYQYQLLHLVGNYENLSRQGGGVGAKGPGETQLETDRRVIKNKLKKLREELEKVVQTREVQSRKRSEGLRTVFSLVGYTNAGKSTLLNNLTGSDVKICDGLFTTLDPAARRVDLNSGRWGILSDTVGFIRKLPHRLVKAFRATLESVVSSEVLLMVCDGSDPQFRERLLAVEDVLGQLEVTDKERLYVFNKIDRGLAADRAAIESDYPGCVFISAKTGEGIAELKEKMDQIISRQYRTVRLAIPSKAEALKEVMQNAMVKSQEWGVGVVNIEAEIPVKLLAKLERYIL